jgi:hypothetical protein
MRAERYEKRPRQPKYNDITECPFLVDPDIFEQIKFWKWNENKQGYFRIIRNGKEIMMHHFVLGIKDLDGNVINPLQNGYVVDHMDRFENNNSRNNLRIVPRSINCYNADIKLPKSGHRGIHETKFGTYQATIGDNSKNATTKTFKTLHEAKRWRKKMAKRLYGENQFN